MIGLGLWIIGIPNPVLWGILGGGGPVRSWLRPFTFRQVDCELVDGRGTRLTGLALRVGLEPQRIQKAPRDRPRYVTCSRRNRSASSEGNSKLIDGRKVRSSTRIRGNALRLSLADPRSNHGKLPSSLEDETRVIGWRRQKL